MKKSGLLKNNDGKISLGVLWIITLAMSAVVFFVLRVGYSKCDDWDIVGMVGGIYGEGKCRYMIPFMNQLLTQPLAMLSKATGIFNIFGYYVFIAMTAAFLSLDYVFYRLRVNVFGYVMLFVVQAMFLFNVTFTTLAFLLAGIGLMFGYLIDSCVKKKIAWYILAAAFIMLGLITRRNVITISVLFLPMLAASVINKKFNGIFLIFIMLIVMYYLLGEVNKMFFAGDDISSYYIKYNSVRAFLHDRPKFDYAAYSTIFQKSNWTEGIYNEFYKGVIYDEKYFGYDALDQIRSGMSFADIYAINAMDLIKDIAHKLIKITPLNIYIAAGSGVLVVSLKDKKYAAQRLECIAIYIMPYVLFAALFIRVRFVDRVAMPFLAFGILNMLICGRADGESPISIKPLKALSALPDKLIRSLKGRKDTKKITAIFSCIAVVFTGILVLNYVNDYRIFKGHSVDDAATKEAFDYINEHKENLYLDFTGMDEKSYFASVPVLGFKEEHFADNLVCRRRWLVNSNGYNEIAKRYNITDQDSYLHSLALCDNMFLLSQEDRIGTYIDFMHDAYGLDVVLRQEKYFDKNNVIYAVSVK